MTIMKHRSSSPLPVSLDNWPALKSAMPGLADAARKTPDQTYASKSLDIKVWLLETGAEVNLGAARNANELTGLRWLTLKETLYALIHDQELLERLKGRTFFLAESKLDLDGIYTIQDDGSLKAGPTRDLSRSLVAHKGVEPLVFSVQDDGIAGVDGWRFYIEERQCSKGRVTAVLGVIPDEAQKGKSPAQTALGSLVGLARRVLGH